MYEPPMDNPSPFMYIAGSDPYNVNTSNTSPSLGTFYVYKRIYDLVNGTYQDMIVASYAGRPNQLKEWNKIIELLLELYQATCMIENAGTNFIEYMDGKHKSHMLADGYNLLREISPNTGIRNRTKGLPPTPQVINHCMALLYDYCNEELTAVDEKGKVTTKLGVTRIPDRMLLIEMLNYNSEDNFDRICAFRHVLAYNQHLQKISPIVNYEEKKDQKPEKVNPLSRSPFITNRSPFSRINRSPFHK
jgi:hypothetical protein